MGVGQASPGSRGAPSWQHYLCWSDVPVPRISVIFSLEELKEIEKDCAIYVGRMERVARHSSVSKEEQVRGPRPGGSLPPPPGAHRVWGQRQLSAWLSCAPGRGPVLLAPGAGWAGHWPSAQGSPPRPRPRSPPG